MDMGRVLPAKAFRGTSRTGQVRKGVGLVSLSHCDGDAQAGQATVANVAFLS